MRPSHHSLQFLMPGKPVLNICSDYLLPQTVACFFFNDTATTEIYTLSLHDALPILSWNGTESISCCPATAMPTSVPGSCTAVARSEEHTSELQSLAYLVCRLLLEKKKN